MLTTPSPLPSHFNGHFPRDLEPWLANSPSVLSFLAAIVPEETFWRRFFLQIVRL